MATPAATSFRRQFEKEQYPLLGKDSAAEPLFNTR